MYNSAILALFMVNISHALLRPMRAQWPAFSVNDLKAWFGGRKYVVETLKLLPEMPDAICIDGTGLPRWLNLGGSTTLSTPLKWRRYCYTSALNMIEVDGVGCGRAVHVARRGFNACPPMLVIGLCKTGT